MNLCTVITLIHQGFSSNILWKHDICIYAWVMFGTSICLKFSFGKLPNQEVDIYEWIIFSKLTFLKLRFNYLQRNYSCIYASIICWQSIFQKFSFHKFRKPILVFMHASDFVNRFFRTWFLTHFENVSWTHARSYLKTRSLRHLGFVIFENMIFRMNHMMKIDSSEI